MRPEVISETVRLWGEQPDKAKRKPTVKARSDGSEAAMEAGPFSWHSDLPEPIGGTNQAPSPTALLLSALAGRLRGGLHSQHPRASVRGPGRHGGGDCTV
jgi:hypothetical protein